LGKQNFHPEKLSADGSYIGGTKLIIGGYVKQKLKLASIKGPWFQRGLLFCCIL